MSIKGRRVELIKAYSVRVGSDLVILEVVEIAEEPPRVHRRGARGDARERHVGTDRNPYRARHLVAPSRRRCTIRDLGVG